MTPRTEDIDPADRGMRKFDKYRPEEAKLEDRGGRTEQTHAFARLLIEFSLAMPEGKVPYAYVRTDGEADRLDWGRLSYLRNAEPPEIDFEEDGQGFVGWVYPTEALFGRYGETQRPADWPPSAKIHPSPMAAAGDIWRSGCSVWLTSFWGWSPETWGTVGFTDAARVDTVVKQTTDPFIVVVYVTKNANAENKDLRGQVVGFYLVSHERGHRDAFTDQMHYNSRPDQWQHSLKAVRAFSFLPEYRIDSDTLDPSLNSRALSVARYGKELGGEQVQRLMEVPFVEVPVFGGPEVIDTTIHIPRRGKHMVRAGPVNRSGYFVAGEPLETEKELYILLLEGDTTAFLGKPEAGRKIVKVGLSMSPVSRCETFARTLPRGAFKWRLHRSTRLDRDVPYPSFEAAEAGERVMKDFLGRRDGWLGGEFYAATPDDIEAAWTAARKAALAVR